MSALVSRGVASGRVYAVDYGRGKGSKPWSVYRLDAAGYARIRLADFATKAEAETWVARRNALRLTAHGHVRLFAARQRAAFGLAARYPRLLP